MTRLLVSVRSATEALSALAGGAAIIDVKEPSRGPLGRADDMVIRAVLAAAADRVPVSAACGELIEPQTPAPHGLAFTKVGLAKQGLDWREQWLRWQTQRTLRDHADPLAGVVPGRSRQFLGKTGQF